MMDKIPGSGDADSQTSMLWEPEWNDFVNLLPVEQAQEVETHVLSCSAQQDSPDDDARQPYNGTGANILQQTSLDSSIKPKRQTISSDARHQVRMWLNEHEADPYPTKEEKAQFASALGLTTRQVSTLFNNERRRHPKRKATSAWFARCAHGLPQDYCINMTSNM
jgi:hypothetical protein